jgi:hypothetical protein
MAVPVALHSLAEAEELEILEATAVPPALLE